MHPYAHLGNGPVDGIVWEHLRQQESVDHEGGLYHLEALVALKVLRTRLARLSTSTGAHREDSLDGMYGRILDTIAEHVRVHAREQRWRMENEPAKIVVTKPCSADEPCDENNPMHVALYGSCFWKRKDGGVMDEHRRPTVE